MFRAPSRQRALAASAAAALALGAAACGDDDDSSSGDSGSTGAEEVTVNAEEYSFDVSATPTADTKSVTFNNEGKEFHVMIFARLSEGFTVDEAVKLEGEKGSATLIAETEAPPGKTKTVDVKEPIEPGNYVMLCPIEGPDGPHYKLGQLEEFSIE